MLNESILDDLEYGTGGFGGLGLELLLGTFRVEIRGR